jgi:hypothetical protein
MTRSALPIAILSIFTALALAACGAPSLDSGELEEDAVDTESDALQSAQPTVIPVKSVNLCEGQVANSFHCIDDTNFQLCIGGDQFVVNACPKGFCATRHPSTKNPCVGAARALEIDGVPPTPAGQLTP